MQRLSNNYSSTYVMENYCSLTKQIIMSPLKTNREHSYSSKTHLNFPTTIAFKSKKL